MTIKRVKNLNVIIDSNLVSGFVITGYGETDMTSSSAENDRVTQKSDAKGKVFTIINEKGNGTLSITLNELSDAVKILDDHLDRSEGMEITRDMPNGQRYKYTDVFVMKEPDKDVTSEDDEYEYECVYGNRTRL